MERIDVAAALRELAGAAARLADLLGAPDDGPSTVSVTEWRSPTRALEPIVVAGEEDLPIALGRGHACLVTPGDGGFSPVEVSDEKRVQLLAVALVGDVALEAAHSGLGESASAVDAMLAKGFSVLASSAADAGVSVPRDLYVAAAMRFPELDTRGGEWR
jgi:hypothetical protein